MLINQNGSSKRLLIIIIALLAIVLVGCGVQEDGGNWAGISSDGDTVYVAWGAGVTAVDIDSQQNLWVYPTKDNQNAIKYLAAPGIGDGALIIADYGENQGMFSPGVLSSVYSINPATGTLIWRAENVAGDSIIASPRPVAGHVFVGTAENSIVALDANGNEKWINELGHAVWGQPAYADGMVIVSSMDKNVYAFDADTGSEIWQFATGGAAAASPLVEDGVVYVSSFDSSLHALDLDTGEEIWSAEAADWIWNAAVLADGNIYYADSKGGVYAVNADSGAPVWQKQLGNAIEAGLVVDGGIVYAPIVSGVSTDDEQSARIVALDSASGTQRWEVILAAPVFTTPVIADGNLVVAQQIDTNNVSLTVLDQDGQIVWQHPVGAGAE